MKAGQTVFNNGDKGDSFLIILSGQVDIYIPNNIQVNAIKVLKRHKTLEIQNWYGIQTKQKLNEYIHKVVNPDECKKIKDFSLVATTSAGMSFGDHALLKNEARAVTCVCKEITQFAVLTRSDYLWIIN